MDIKQIIEELGLDNQLTLEDIPQIDLYMDQVIQLFENNFSSSKRYEDDKVLTKTMINNYAKGKLLLPIKNKKYSKEHLILISLIYQLKGALSISDIKAVLNGIIDRIPEDELDLDHFYSSYLHLAEKNILNFKKDVDLQAANVNEMAIKLEDTYSEELEKVLLAASLVNMSNYYRRAAEYLIDDLADRDKNT